MLSRAVAQIFSPYQSLNLSAFDNLKLVVAVLSNNAQECHALSADVSIGGKLTSAYLVRWGKHFIYCGRCNAYSSKIDEVTHLETIDPESITVLQPPVLSMQQVSFMCMENAHFDHC
ncbi:hypothetical protein N9W21_03660 [Shewanella sp.]|nr:hypothetical protein [Shewanella sp.]